MSQRLKYWATVCGVFILLVLGFVIVGILGYVTLGLGFLASLASRQITEKWLEIRETPSEKGESGEGGQVR